MRLDFDLTQELIGTISAAYDAPWTPGQTRFERTDDNGRGQIQKIAVPGGLDFYHYQTCFSNETEIHTHNPADSGRYGLNINLDDHGLRRQVGDQEVVLQSRRPSGILVHPPGSHVFGKNPGGKASESAFILFDEAFVDTYFPGLRPHLGPTRGGILFEHLDYRSEHLLRSAIDCLDQPLIAHARLLEFMALFASNLGRRSPKQNPSVEGERLASADLQGLFAAAATLRDPLAGHTPSIDELAKIARMGTTKFKTNFRAVFGTPPGRYHLKVKLEFAHDQLTAGRATASELSYSLGYSHPSKFTEAFKKHFGQLPSDLAPVPSRP